MQMMCNTYAQNRFHNLKTHFEIFEAPLTFYLVANCHASEIYVWQIWFNFPHKGWIYRKTMEQNTSIQNLRHSNMLAGERRPHYGFFIVPRITWLGSFSFPYKGRTGGLHHCSIETTKFWKKSVDQAKDFTFEFAWHLHSPRCEPAIFHSRQKSGDSFMGTCGGRRIYSWKKYWKFCIWISIILETKWPLLVINPSKQGPWVPGIYVESYLIIEG